MIGQCATSTYCITEDDIPDLPPGYIALVSFGVLIAAAALGVGGGAFYKFWKAKKIGPAGGRAQDFAVD